MVEQLLRTAEWTGVAHVLYFKLLMPRKPGTLANQSSHDRLEQRCTLHITQTQDGRDHPRVGGAVEGADRCVKEWRRDRGGLCGHMVRALPHDLALLRAAVVRVPGHEVREGARVLLCCEKGGGSCVQTAFRPGTCDGERAGSQPASAVQDADAVCIEDGGRGMHCPAASHHTVMAGEGIFSCLPPPPCCNTASGSISLIFLLWARHIMCACAHQRVPSRAPAFH